MRSSSHAHRRAKEFRRSLSPPEALLWTFRRQHPIGPYIADFYYSAGKLVIEVDGAGHSEDREIEHDRRRDIYLARLGYRVIRFPAGDVFRDVDDVVQGIVQAALAPPPPPDLRSGGPPPPLRG